jgi:hypothetical protein
MGKSFFDINKIDVFENESIIKKRLKQQWKGIPQNNTTTFMGQTCCLIFKDNTFALGKGHSTSQSNTTIS